MLYARIFASFHVYAEFHYGERMAGTPSVRCGSRSRLPTSECSSISTAPLSDVAPDFVENMFLLALSALKALPDTGGEGAKAEVTTGSSYRCCGVLGETSMLSWRPWVTALVGVAGLAWEMTGEGWKVVDESRRCDGTGAGSE
jgi:hypothetical protein